MQVRPSTIRVVLVLLAVLVYANSLAGQFIFDDIISIVWNPHIRQVWPPTATPQSSLAGRPVASFSRCSRVVWPRCSRWRRRR